MPLLLDGAAALALWVVIGISRLSGGLHWNVMAYVAMGLSTGGILLRAWSLWQGDGVGLPWPADEGVLPQWGHTAVRSFAWMSAMVATQVAIVRCQFDGPSLREVRWQTLGLYVLCTVGAFLPLPGRGLVFTTSLGTIGVVFLYDLVRGLWWAPRGPYVTLRSPFTEPAVVFHGGHSPLLNHHHPIQQQRHAVDLVTAIDGHHAPGDPDVVEGHACWGLPLVAPAAGEVVAARDDLPDQAIGESDEDNLAGNLLVVKMAEERFIILAHLQQGSLAVAVGDRVEAGDLLGRCGNSGNTSGPHLHMQVSNRPILDNDDDDAHTIPIRFTRRVRHGVVREGYARRNDEVWPPLHDRADGDGEQRPMA